MTVRELDAAPAFPGLYAKAIASALPGVGAGSPQTVSGPRPMRIVSLSINADRLATYRDVCGFHGPGVPPTYLQMLAFPLQLAMLTDPAFPFGALGVTHIANTIEVLKPIDAASTPALTVACGPVQPHPRGRQVALLSEAATEGETVWRSKATMLSRSAADPHAEAPSGIQEPESPAAGLPAEAPSGPQLWRLPSNLGRRYAAVSGDRNPIHLFDVTALPFGFRRHIAHGMWTKARCLAELENRLPDAFTVEVAFRKPLQLPGTVRFGARQTADRIDFGLSPRRDGSPHLVGCITWPST